MAGAARVFQAFPPSGPCPLVIAAPPSNTNTIPSSLFISHLLEFPLSFYIRTAVLNILYGFGPDGFRFVLTVNPGRSASTRHML
jgi:hypothetical protein